MPRQDSIALVERALAEIRRGRMVILTDDEDRENEGDLVMAAQKVTPAAINFMAKHGRGLVCLALSEERCRDLDLPLMVEDNTSPFGTAFTVSIEARGKVTTGISAADRAATIGCRLSCRQRSSVSVRQIRPRPCLAMKLIASGDTKSAASTRSPSFSRSSSSMRITMRPALSSAMMSWMGLRAEVMAVGKSRVSSGA